MADTAGLGPAIERYGGSSPLLGTIELGVKLWTYRRKLYARMMVRFLLSMKEAYTIMKNLQENFQTTCTKSGLLTTLTQDILI